MIYDSYCGAFDFYFLGGIMDFFQAIESCFKKYATFSGRASRSEYWFFVLFRFITGVIATLLDKTALQDYTFTYHIGNKVEEAGLMGIILGVVLFMPGVAVLFRRLHDINKSGWWIAGIMVYTFLAGCISGLALFFHLAYVQMFVAVAIIIPFLLLLYWLVKKGTPGDNRFGPDPLAVKP